MRASTACCAPVPSATIVMTAPTPMMMPSMVSTERSALARMDWKATANVSPNCTASGPWPVPPVVVVVCRMPGTPPAAGDLIDALPHVLLRLHQARAGQHVARNRPPRVPAAPRCSPGRSGRCGSTPASGTPRRLANTMYRPALAAPLRACRVKPPWPPAWPRTRRRWAESPRAGRSESGRGASSASPVRGEAPAEAWESEADAASCRCTASVERPSTWAAEPTSRGVRSAAFGTASTLSRRPTWISTSVFIPGLSSPLAVLDPDQHREHGDVLLGLGLGLDLEHRALERPVGIRVHGDRGALARPASCRCRSRPPGCAPAPGSGRPS